MKRWLALMLFLVCMDAHAQQLVSCGAGPCVYPGVPTNAGDPAYNSFGKLNTNWLTLSAEGLIQSGSSNPGLLLTNYGGTGNSTGQAQSIVGQARSATIDTTNASNITTGQFSIGSFIAPIVSSVAGSASQSAQTWTGAPYTGGTPTTNWPLTYQNYSGATAVTTFSLAGTEYGINAPSGFIGNFEDYYVNGTEVVYQDYLGNFHFAVQNGTSTGPLIATLSSSLGGISTANTITVAGGGTSSTQTGNFQCWPYMVSVSGGPPSGSSFYPTLLYVGGDGDMTFCGGAAAPIWNFVMMNNNAGQGGIFQITNSALHGPEFRLTTDASTSCPGLGSGLTYSGPCDELWNDNQVTSVYPFFILSHFGSLHAVYGILANEIIERVGDTTPTTFNLCTSSGTSNAICTYGDSNSGSTTTNQGGNTSCTESQWSAGSAGTSGMVCNQPVTSPAQNTNGTAFTVAVASGSCSVSSSVITGGSTAGSFTVTTGATTCAFTITMGGTVAAAHDWVCNGADTTDAIVAIQSNSAASTTTCKLTITGAIATNAVVKFNAMGF